MTDTIITYDSIYEAFRKEKYESEIQKLQDTFYLDIINYLKEKQAILENQKSQKTVFSNEPVKIERQIQNIKKILKDLYEKRENKIVQLALFFSRSDTKVDISNLLSEEQEFFKTIHEVFKNYKEGILSNLLALKEPKIIQPKAIKTEFEEESKLVRFITPVPKFMGEDLNIYGPFNSDDIASLPPKAASLLIENKRAQEIENT